MRNRDKKPGNYNKLWYEQITRKKKKKEFSKNVLFVVEYGKKSGKKANEKCDVCRLTNCYVSCSHKVRYAWTDSSIQDGKP